MCPIGQNIYQVASLIRDGLAMSSNAYIWWTVVPNLVTQLYIRSKHCLLHYSAQCCFRAGVSFPTTLSHADHVQTAFVRTHIHNTSWLLDPHFGCLSLKNSNETYLACVYFISGHNFHKCLWAALLCPCSFQSLLHPETLSHRHKDRQLRMNSQCQ